LSDFRRFTLESELAELLILCLPWIANTAHAEDRTSKPRAKAR
jgi:hypothetical protein